MDVNAIGMPTNRPLMAQSSPPSAEATDVPDAKNYAGTQSDLAKVNTAKSELPDGVGAKVDKTA
jgi:hypothetical protein